MAQDSQPTWQELLDLVAQLAEGDFDSAAISYGTVSVQLSKSSAVPATLDPAPSAPPAPAPATPMAETIATAANPGSSAQGGPSAQVDALTITAPMLGVFYRRPSPGADPFVEPGQEVQPDTTIGIIEIMKLMNPVVAGVSGVIVSFDVEDGTSVEFGQALARFAPVT